MKASVAFGAGVACGISSTLGLAELIRKVGTEIARQDRLKQDAVMPKRQFVGGNGDIGSALQNLDDTINGLRRRLNQANKHVELVTADFRTAPASPGERVVSQGCCEGCCS